MLLNLVHSFLNNTQQHPSDPMPLTILINYLECRAKMTKISSSQNATVYLCEIFHIYLRHLHALNLHYESNSSRENVMHFGTRFQFFFSEIHSFRDYCSRHILQSVCVVASDCAQMLGRLRALSEDREK